MIKEAMFGVNDFSKPNISKGNNALITAILMILFGRPGVYPSYPDLGMNIQQYFYSFSDNLDTDSLKKQLALQCSFLVDYVNDEIIDIKLTQTNDEKMAILVTLPVMETAPNNILVIGITTDNSGTVIYNYEIMQGL